MYEIKELDHHEVEQIAGGPWWIPVLVVGTFLVGVADGFTEAQEADRK